MAEFEDLRKDLDEARERSHAARRELFRLKQRLALAKREQRRKQRFAPRSADGAAANRPQTEIDALQAQIDGLRGRLRAHRGAERERFERFADFTDPRRHSGRLSDRTPILLLPLRIETRFKLGEAGGTSGHALWVRAYPDDVSIDAFEDTLSENEVRKAQTYWADIWRAGGNEADERGAWRVLLSGQGAGRSYWVIQNYRPLNEEQQPQKAAGVPTVILTVVTQNPLLEPERTQVSAFWEALWRAGDDAQAQAAAVAALEAQLGAARARVIEADYAPRNLADPPPEGATRDDTAVVVAFLEFPADDALALRESGWSQAPHAATLPDRLVLLGYRGGELVLEQLGNPIPSPLPVAPDPSADEDEQIRRDGAEIEVDPELAWVTDFERAIEVGMAFRVPLPPAELTRGFDELIVLGVRMAADAERGRLALETLLQHHHASRAGCAFVPQGRPTNNVEGEGAAYSWQEDSDASFDHYFGEPVAEPTGGYGQQDGRRFAEILGLDPAVLRPIEFYTRTDIGDALALNTALWPATLGYFMSSMLQPVFAEATVEQTRELFTAHVLARGRIPAIRIGKQPYGILPATPRSRIEWLFDRRADVPGVAARTDPGARYLEHLYRLLRKAEADFGALASKVSFVGKAGADPHQVLLDVVGLHSGAVEYQQRYAESAIELYNRLSMQGAGGAFLAVLIALGYVRSGLDLLAALGYEAGEGAETPDILEKLFLSTPNALKGGLIDDRALSETDPIRAYTEAGRNYIEWLREAAATSHDALRLQKGFAGGPPTALLYLLLRHALDLNYVETSVRLFANAGLIDQAELSAARKEPSFVQVQQTSLAAPAAAGGSRWQYLYRTDVAVSGAPDRTVGQFIPTVLTSMTATAYLKRQLDALEHLQHRPTAVLERVLAEHIDLCTYRLDAWYGALLSHQLDALRFDERPEAASTAPAGSGPALEARTGLYLGAYGWLENVKPELKVMEPVELPAELDAVFDASAESPLLRDRQNHGYIHAPSVNHAVTAAVLRNGYLSNATPQNPGSLAINLTSERVRVALSIVQGMQAEQSLGALLGYHFERGLHDRHDVEVDEFIFDLRKVFPLVGDRLAPTRTGATDEHGKKLGIGRVEARNVVDGLALVEHMRASGKRTYPFGFDTGLPAASPAQSAAISAQAQRLENIADAVADLAMAESVHQVVQGNYDRAGAVLDTYSKGKSPSIPDVIRTPRSGVTLHHRVALHLKPQLDPTNPSLTSPRAKAEPALNDWLGAILPAASAVACTVTVTDPLDASAVTHMITQADLQLLPIDMLYVLDADDERTGRSLDDLIEGHVIATLGPRPHAQLAIAYRDRIPAIPAHVPFFELAALIRPLRSLLLRSRPLRATDMALAEEGTSATDIDVALAPERITLVRDELTGHLAALTAFHAALQTRLDAEERALIATEIDQTIDDFTALMAALGPYARLDTGTSTVFADRRRMFAALLALLQRRIERWEERLAEFDLAIAAYDAVPGAPIEQKFLALQMAERLVSTERTSPLPALPDTLRDDLVGIKRAAVEAQRSVFAALHAGAAGLSVLHDGIAAAESAIAAFDPLALELPEHTAQLVVLAEDMAKRAASLVADLAERFDAVQAQVAAAAAEVDGKTKVELLTAAIKLMLGEDFTIVPDFALPVAQADEWTNAWGAGSVADTSILDHVRNDVGRRFPVDDWFAGVARVREKMHHLESAAHLAGAFTGAELPLQPLQFPVRPDTPWLGLEFPETTAAGEPFEIDEDKLLYTALYASRFDAAQRHAGLLLDEWTEVIPKRSEDTGLAFHYDRPSSEPPQTLLLALPPKYTGGWRWQDLVDTVRETMDLAKKRAIEPDHIDTTAYGRFLPALISAVTLHPITASLNLAFNNGLAAELAAAEDGADE